MNLKLSSSFRSLLPLLSAASFALAFAHPSFADDARQLQIKTKQGKVQGKLVGGDSAASSSQAGAATDAQVRAFLGIPYATPPVGPLRWTAPTPAAKWKGVRQATAFGPHCMQPKLYNDMVFRDPGPSEDCLTLNVWTPAPDKSVKSAKLPVMVWIYGGGYVGGGSSEARQDGANLARNGVVVVSMNYRLGIFGFFASAALAAESPHAAAGNYGLLDQTAALQWVRENIAAFGGDPANVTVFGESAGSFSVSAQMASPLAKGLFERAIGESGGAFSKTTLPTATLAQAEARDAAFAHDNLGADTLAQLRALPAQQVMEAEFKRPAQGQPLRFYPVVDGYFLPRSVAAIFAAGTQNDVPLLAGWNHDEGGIASKVTVDSYQKVVAAEFPDSAAQLMALYPAATDAEAVRSAADLAADRFIAWSTWRWIEEQSATGKQPIHRYRFDLPPPADPNHLGGLAAYHSSEIPYVFGTLDLLSGFAWRAEDRALSRQMQKYWTNFARSGDPNGDGLPQWPAYAAATGWQVLYLSPQTAAAPDKTRQRDLFLDTIWAK